MKSKKLDIPPGACEDPDTGVCATVPMKQAYFLVLPNTHLLDLAGPLQIMTTLNELGVSNIRTECIGPVATTHAFQRITLARISPLPPRLEADSILFVIGAKLSDAVMTSKPWLDAVAWVNRQITSGDTSLRICGVCTGTFLLAQAGALNGRLCTTHYRFVDRLQKEYPLARATKNRICVRDGNLWTSAGVTSGIDLTLHLIADIFGENVALQVAQENVAHFRRFGGDPELDALLRYRSHGNSFIHTVQDMISRDLSKNWSYSSLAASVGYSERHLVRIFVAETGITIKRFQTELRLDLARRLLKESALSLEKIAERCGYASVQAFRANWNKFEGCSPSALRAGSV